MQTTEPITLSIQEKCHSTELFVGRHLLATSTLARLCSSIAKKWALIADETSFTLCGKMICDLFAQNGLMLTISLFRSGEEAKTRKNKERIEDELLDAGLSKDGAILTLGGGVASDLGGFIAATFCRGIPYIALPTTLLAMVDAAIGGKCGVNTRHGKNLIGAIWQPAAIVADVSLLSTLPERQISCGVVEMLKAALLYDKSYFQRLAASSQRVFACDAELLIELITRSLLIKREFVQADSREKSRRAALNLGHTVGHALEQLSGYAIYHGEAVAAGLLVESSIMVKMGLVASSVVDAIKEALHSYRVVLPSWSQDDIQPLLELMHRDKKSRGGKIRIAALKEIGRLYNDEGDPCIDVEDEMMKEALMLPI